jgi:hypothetical protein
MKIHMYCVRLRLFGAVCSENQTDCVRDMPGYLMLKQAVQTITSYSVLFLQRASLATPIIAAQHCATLHT